MKLKSKLRQLAAIWLAVLFFLTPLAPVFAAEGETVPSETITTPTTTDSANTVTPPADSSSNSTSETPQEEELSTDTEEGPGDEQESSSLVQPDPSVNIDLPQSTIKQSLPQSDRVNGSLVYSYPITIPPGRNGLQPDLALNYSSQSVTDGSIFGAGWSLNIPYIERLSKTGFDKLYTDNYFNSSLSGELISLGSGSYGSKVDNGEFLTYALSSNVWTVKDKKGTVYTFGAAAGSRQDNPSDSSKVYKWMLSEVRDTNDNYIKYTYYKHNGQIYPASIIYTGNGSTDGIFEIDFTRTSRTDAITSSKYGFTVTTSYYITQIDVLISSSWIRRYAIAYTTGHNGTRSLLDTITESGRDESGTTTSLADINFNYQSPTAGWTQDTNWSSPVDFTQGVYIVDVNGDGLTDIVQSVKNGSSVTPIRRTYLNTGTGWSLSSDWVPPITFFDQFTPVFDQGARVVDVNGDGLADIIQDNGSSHSAYLNNGSTGWASSSTWLPSVQFAKSNSTDPEPGTTIADLNGDGLVDLLYAKYVGASITTNAYLNNGAGWTLDTAWTSPLDLNQSVYIADVNGDGLADMLQSYTYNSTDTKNAYINTGDKTWVLDTNWQPPITFVNDNNGYDLGARLADINGDGLVDIIRRNYNSGSSAAYLNTGKGWASNSSWLSPIDITNASTSGQDLGVRVEDINGDGLADIIKALPNNSNVLVTDAYINNGPRADLISTITYPTAGSTSITYKATPKYTSSGTLLNPNLPYVLDTVYQIANSDGLGLTSTYTYSYAGGLYYYNTAFDRQFAGFASITKTDAASNTTKSYFHQGNATNSSQGEYSDHASKIGKVYRTDIANGSNKYQSTINKWDYYNLGSGRSFVKLVQTINQTFDGDSSHKDTANAFTYDDSTGDVTQKISWGEVTGTDSGTFTDTGSDKFTTDIAYASNGTTNVYVPKTETVTDQSSVKVRESKYYYDTQSHGTVTKGNQTKEEKWKVSTTYVNTQKAYNSTYGTVSSTTDERGKVTTYSNDTYNLYPASVTNPLSQVTSYTYDYSAGKVKQTTDPNTRVFQTIYDGLDRVIEEKQPDFTTPSTLVTKTTYAYTPQTIGTQILKTDYLDGSTTVVTYTYTDGFDRPIQVRTEAEGTYSVKDTIYNTIEQVYQESLPYFSSGTSKTSPTGTSSLLITYSYDPMLRVTSTVNAIGTTNNAYDDWKVTITDPRSKTKDLYKDAYGNLVRVDEHNSANTYSTYYTYNGNQNLLSITDALGNVRNFTYDGLGRKLTAEDLHASGDGTYGSYTYTYDDAGNLTQQVDPNSQTITYTYDDINRVLTENYTGATGTEVTYAYDSGTDGVGKLTSVTKLDGVNSAYTYNPLGLTKRETKTIQATDYITDYTYDRQGNKLTITNPDSSIVKYIYNSAGLLDQVQRKESGDPSYTNVVSNFDYSPTGQQTTIAYHNGVTTTNTYDSTKLYRLNAKTSINGSSVHLQDLAYTYDNNGNITQIVDASSTHSAKTANYTYDDLNRLLSATITSVASGTQPYTENYSYDAIGNISTKTGQGSYAYAGNTGSSYANPHAVTSIGASSLTYDNNGNVLTSPSGIATSSIALDATSTSITNGYNGGPTTKTWTHTTSSGSNRLLVLSADIWQDVAGTGTITAASYNGVALTKATNTRTGGMASEVWYLVNPSSGANTVSVTVTGATDSIKLATSTFTGLNQSMPYVAASTTTGGSGNPSVSTTTSNANSLLTATLSRFSTTAATTNKTSLYNNNTGSTLGAASYQVSTTTGSYSDTYTGSAASDWSMIMVEFKPAQTTLTNTWDYNNRLTQSVQGSVTSVYNYDHSGQRVRLYNGTTNTHYPTPYYNANGTTETKHIFDDHGTMLATVSKTSGTPTLYYTHTDHLTGAAVVTTSSGTQEELMDYFPFGSMRLDEKAGSWSEQRKYTGHEFDGDTGLTYANARYYDPAIGRFISQDPAFINLTHLQVQLADPQSWNSYAYANNNPLINVDPNGNLSINVFGFLPNSVQVKIGNKAEGAYQNNSVARFAMDHPWVPTAVGAAPIIAYTGYLTAPAITSAAGAIVKSPLAAPFIRAGAIGAVGGLASQGISDVVNGQLSPAGTYGGSAMKGSTIGIGGQLYGPLGAGIAGAGTSTTSDLYSNRSVSIPNAIGNGLFSAGGAKLTNSAKGIPGRLPNLGSLSYYIGQHAKYEGMKEVVNTAIDGLKSIFGGILKTVGN